AAYRNDGDVPVTVRALSIDAAAPGQPTQTARFPAHTFAAGESLTLQASLALPAAGRWYVYAAFIDAWGSERAAPGLDVVVDGAVTPLFPLPLAPATVEATPGAAIDASAGFRNADSAPHSVYYATITVRAPGQTHAQMPFRDFLPPLAGNNNPYP